MKRYLLFAGSVYYPAGGWDDFINDFEVLEDAVDVAKWLDEDWCHIIDTVTKLRTDGRSVVD